MSLKQFNNSMNYETHSMLNWKKKAAIAIPFNVLYNIANGQLAMADD